ncbi:MAG: hypothetical protein GC171_12725 [Terrimonas sp.]|nr:hypothetical protein [Terrimonas sp.]
MSGNLKDILSHLSPDIDQETLLLYLQGKLAEEKKHEVEKQMLDSDFDADAFEGLVSMQGKENLSGLVEQLNRDLQKRLEKKKKFREKLRFKDHPWIYFTVIIVLLLIIISYFIIHKLLHNQP